MYRIAYNRSFRDGETERLFHRESPRKFAAIAERAYGKLIQVGRAKDLKDLATLPGIALEKLTGNRTGQYSIRTNNRYRGRRSISADTALRLSRWLGASRFLARLASAV